MHTISEIRKDFLNFFAQKHHTILPSSSLIPHDDPTLMFANSGMVQFKDFFTMRCTPTHRRVTTVQKCLRAGGKHNDLENVGYTKRHHTFFEMLGNFSFGDYFKEQAILYAFELITKVWGLAKERLIITVHSQDEQSLMLWKKIASLDEGRIIKIDTSDNFWSMGDSGPCGPCSEIFYDHGPHIPGGLPGSVDQDGDRFVEIWNLVFMQYERHLDGSMTPLPVACVDTGMGLERIATVLQGVHDNYETDLFTTLLNHISDCSSTPSHVHPQSKRVVADHVRACVFMMADGILPSNEGRGYVLRRIMRRGLRHARLISHQVPIMSHVAPLLIDLMKDPYKELEAAAPFIIPTIIEEEERFTHLLEKGLKLLDDAKTTITKKTLDGMTAFKLYDTYGFPLDLTQDILKKDGIGVDEEGFWQSMDAQKKQSRAAWSGSGEQGIDQRWVDLNQHIPPTEFVGYEHLETVATIESLIKMDDEGDISSGNNGDGDSHYYLITNTTPFYAQSGGQVADRGIIMDPSNQHILGRVMDVQKKMNLYVHQVVWTHQEADPSSWSKKKILMRVDNLRRASIAAHHSATHLLHATLGQVLGGHVIQKGSLVDEQYMRFDFTHHHPLTQEQIQQVEDTVNAMIMANKPSHIEVMDCEQAKEKGFIALFGQKYGSKVRTINFDGFSMELCAGTHVASTGQIAMFKITHQSSCGAGIRRIEAVGGRWAMEYFRHKEKQNQDTIDEYKAQINQLHKKIEKIEKKSFINQGSDIKKITVDPYLLWHLPLVDADSKDLKGINDDIKNQMGEGIVLITNVVGERLTVVIGVSPSLVKKISAIDLVKKCAPLIGAKGAGGHDAMAQTGGYTPHSLCVIEDVLKEALNE
jgi:alanyl-tRNA synthetase